MNLKHKVIALTGATGGIGRELAIQLDAKGARLILMSRSSEALAELNQSLFGRHRILAFDVVDTDAMQNHLDELSRLGVVIDILINNAACSCFGPLSSMGPADTQRVLETNLIAPVQLTRATLPLLSKIQARIVNVGSVFGDVGYPCFSVYCGSKFGLKGFSEALNRELSDSNVLVQYVAPRATNTSANSDSVNRLNKALGNSVDAPCDVAQLILQAIEKDRGKSVFGYREKWFIRLNSLSRKLVDKVISSQLSIIKSHTQDVAQ